MMMLKAGLSAISSNVRRWRRWCSHHPSGGTLGAWRQKPGSETSTSTSGSRGTPQYLRSDNGPEFIAHRIRRWLGRAAITTAYIDPGKPWQNGVGESFHSRFRDECLNQGAFFTVREAAVLIEQYRRTYNEARPHSSLHYHTPAEVAIRRARPHWEPSPQHGREAPVAVA